MATLLKDLPFEDLLNFYDRAWQWKKILRNDHPNVRFAMGEETDIDAIRARIVIDMHRIWKAMEQRIPASFQEEINQLLTMPQQPKPIQAGQRWQHRHQRDFIIEIAGREDHSPYWHVSQWRSQAYLCTCFMSSVTIMQDFQKLDP